jgi:hypothetical protein
MSFLFVIDAKRSRLKRRVEVLTLRSYSDSRELQLNCLSLGYPEHGEGVQEKQALSATLPPDTGCSLKIRALLKPRSCSSFTSPLAARPEDRLLRDTTFRILGPRSFSEAHHLVRKSHARSSNLPGYAAFTFFLHRTLIVSRPKWR